MSGRQIFIPENVPKQWSKVAIIGCLCLLLALFPVFYYYFDPKWDAYWLNNAGEKALKQGKYSEARANFKEAINLNPDPIQYHFNLAEVQLKSGDLIESAKILKKILLLSPNNKKAQRQLKILLQEDGILVEQWYRQAVELVNANKLLKAQKILEEGNSVGYKHPEASKMLTSLQKKRYLCLLHCATAQKKLVQGKITSANYHLREASYLYPDEPMVVKIQAEIQNFTQKFGSQTTIETNIFGIIESMTKDDHQLVKVVKIICPEAMCEVMEEAMSFPDYSNNKLECWLKALKKKGYSYKEKKVKNTTVVTIFKKG